MIRRLSILLLFVSVIMIIHKIYSEYQINNCYLKCSDYQLLGEATHWDYIDFMIADGDTIWIDEESYNDWCICIDECKPGLCCELLR